MTPSRLVSPGPVARSGATSVKVARSGAITSPCRALWGDTVSDRLSRDRLRPCWGVPHGSADQPPSGQSPTRGRCRGLGIRRGSEPWATAGATLRALVPWGHAHTNTYRHTRRGAAGGAAHPVGKLTLGPTSNTHQ